MNVKLLQNDQSAEVERQMANTEDVKNTNLVVQERSVDFFQLFGHNYKTFDSQLQLLQRCMNGSQHSVEAINLLKQNSRE
jgi:hypothetical protein